jgi:hypothetical protein
MGFGLANGFIDHMYTSLATTSSDIANFHTLQITAAPAKSSPACSVSNSRSLATSANNGDSSVTRAQVLLTQPPMQNSYQLSTEPWRAQLATELVVKSKSKSHCDWQSVSLSVCLGVEPRLGLMARYLLLVDSYGLVFVGRPLWRKDGSVFCICCWPLPVQSFSGPSPLGLAAWTGCPNSLLYNSFARIE